MPTQARGFIPAETGDEDADIERHNPWQAWTEPRTLLIGLFVLCMAFSEGTGNDWLGVAAIDGYGASAALGSFAYVAFVVAMTTGRWFGPRVLDRYGRVTVLRTSALCALIGVVTVVYGPALATAIIGVLLWGVGSALGFPTGVSAAADDPYRAAGRVSTVATIGYAAFLAAPRSSAWSATTSASSTPSPSPQRSWRSAPPSVDHATADDGRSERRRNSGFTHDLTAIHAGDPADDSSDAPRVVRPQFRRPCSVPFLPVLVPS